MRRKMPYPAKIMTIGVLFKAVVMGTLVTILAATSFAQSIILVLVSATATGIFGMVIVLIQARSERGIHDRISDVENQIANQGNAIQTQNTELKRRASDLAESTKQIKEAVTPTEETK